MEQEVERVFEVLQQDGLLLVSDPTLPSVVRLIAGTAVRGSWWGHPQGTTIYRVAGALSRHPDVTAVKLVSGKETFVHRALWAALFVVASAHEPWQRRKLSDAAVTLLGLVQEAGELRTDDVPWLYTPQPKKTGDAARELERRLLVHSGELHTETGAHAKVLQTWQRWARRVDLDTQRGHSTVALAKQELERVLKRLNAEHGGHGRLPWIAGPRHSQD